GAGVRDRRRDLRCAASRVRRASPDVDVLRATMRRVLWLAAAVLAGAVSMSLEIAALRLIAPALGASIEVWGTLISVVLAATTIALGAVGLLTARAYGVAGAAIALLFAAPERKLPPHTTWSGESVYHTVQVVELGTMKGLVLDHRASLNSAFDPKGGLTHGY